MRNNKGFSLVELIVVIAIMAVLAAVAVIGVSIYVPKAQQAADKQLVADIEQATNLYYQSNADDMESGYVVISPNEAPIAVGSGAEVMKLIYGENWAERNDLKLAYNGWTDDGILEYVLSNSSNATTIINSNYVKNNSTSELIDSFATVTESLAGIAGGAQADPLETMKFKVLTEEEANSIASTLNQKGLRWETGANNDAYTTALSNLLIKNVTSEIGDAEIVGSDEPPELSALAQMAQTYAAIYGWAATDVKGQETLDRINAVISNPESDTADIMAAFEFSDEEGNAFADHYIESGKYDQDMAALPVIMGAVSDITADFDITVSGAFSADSIGDKVTNYINAASAISNLSPDQVDVLRNISNGAIVIFVTSNGQVSVVPEV